MKKVKIFLASSIEDLREDRLQVGDFFRQLNEIYLDSGVHFSLVKCEDYDNSIASGGKQQQYDREIRESELVFFLFFRKVGDYTRHEFEVAMEGFKDRQKPRIVTYFKYINSADEAVQEVRDFMRLLDREVGHYYNTYGHIDTLKLGVLMQIKLLQLDSSQIKLENGAVSLNGQPVVKAENVPLLNGNQTLRELTQERKRLQAELSRCRSAYLEDPTPENEDAFFNASAELNRVSKQLTEVEQETMALLTTVAEMTSDGRVLTHRQKEALKYFNQGDYTAVQAILEDGERENELRRAQQRAEVAKNEIQGHVEEELLLIKTKKAQGLTKARVEEILTGYRKVAELVEKYDLDKTVLYDYAAFLFHQNRYVEADILARKLSWYYSNPSVEVKEEQKAALYDLLGVVYGKTQRYAETEAAYDKMLEIYSRLAVQNPEAYEQRLARSYGNLGWLYDITQRYEKAEDAFGRAKEILIRLAERNPEICELDLAWIYMNLGDLYRTTQRYEEAEAAFAGSLQIHMRLAERDPERYERGLANCYIALGNFYRETQRYADAEKAHIKSVEILARLAEQNPDAYEPALVAGRNGLGVLYYDSRRYEAADESFTKALEIIGRLAKRNPEVYEPTLARCYNNLANLYGAIRRYEDAEKAYIKALEIRMGLAERNPEVYEQELAENYTNLGISYSNTKHYEKAEDAFCRALEIFNRLAERNPKVYEPYLAKHGYNLGRFYGKIKRYGKAVEVSAKTIEIYTRLAEQNPEVYEPDLAGSCNGQGYLYRLTHRYEKAVEAYGRAVEIYTRLAGQTPEVYEPKLTDTLWSLFELYELQKDTRKLLDLCVKAQPLFEKMAKKVPERYKKKYEHICKKSERIVDEFSFF